MSVPYLALLLAGFSSGLPLLLVGKCLQAWLTTAGLSLEALGAAGLVAAPWTFKVLWAPLVDRWAPPGGRRRGWILACVIGLTLGTAAMAWHKPPDGMTLLVVNALLIAVFSATQDVAIDAWRIENLPAERQGAGAAAGVMGYRLALIVTGGLGFTLADRLGWPQVYLLMAVAQGVGLLAAALMRDLPRQIPAPATWQGAVVDPLGDLWQRHGAAGFALLVGIAVFYKFGDFLASSLSTPFLLKDQGFTLAEIGWVQNSWGIVATILGVVAGGALLPRVGIVRGLLWFGLIQATTNLSYAALAAWGGGLPALMAVMTIENLGSGLGTAALVAYFGSRCSPAYAATQYALLSSLMALGRDVLAAGGGWVKVHAGMSWTAYFIVCALAGIPALLLIVGLRRNGPTAGP